MKHYTQFLKKRTLRLIQLGKMSRTLSHDIEETERKLKALKQQSEEIESEIFSNVFHLYGRGTSEVIETAQQRADEYNHNRVMNYPQHEDNERRND